MSNPRAHDLGIRIGTGRCGPLNALTDVAGVRVGHRTIVRDDGPHAIRTGVTAIFPHVGDPWNEWVYAGTHILNGYGELIGVNQLREWGVLMSPIVLTSSQQIGKAYDATLRWMASRDGKAAEQVMPVISECDDSGLSDILSFPLTDEDVAAALDDAVDGPVAEGCVGAGTGMQCFDFKGGIGTSSRILPDVDGAYTVGVLVLTNDGDRDTPAHRRGPGGTRAGRSDARAHHGRIVRRGGRHRRAAPSASAPARGRAGGHGPGRHRFPRVERERRADAGVLHGEPPHVGLTRWWTWPPRSTALGVALASLSRIFEATVDARRRPSRTPSFAAETTVGRNGNILLAMPMDRALGVMERAGRGS